MQTQKVTSYCTRYKILKPIHTIQQLRKNLQQTNQDGYQLAITSDFAIRRYQRYSQNIQNLLPLAEWRLEAQEEIAHCYYIQLGKPNLKNKSISFQIYTEHIELLIRDANKLITAESLYILVGSLRGYSFLLKKFEKISVNAQTFGLNMLGRPIVWINKELDQMIPQSKYLKDQNEILKRLIEIIREKSQFASQKVLNKLMQYSIRYNCKISEMLVYIQNFMNAYEIKLPVNLKYLVNRNKILSDLKAIKNNNNQNKTTKSNKLFKVPLQFNKKNRSKQNNFRSKQKYTNTQTSKQIKIGVNTDTNVQTPTFSRPKRFPSRISSVDSETSQSFIKKKFKNTFDNIYQKTLDKSSKTDVNSRRNSFDTSNISIINKLANIGSNASIDKSCLFSQKNAKWNSILSTSQVPTSSSLLQGDRRHSNSSLGKLSSKTKTVYKSFISRFRNGLNKQVHEDQKQSCQSSPERDNTSDPKIIYKQSFKSLEMSFGISAQKKNEIILKGNNWIKTLDGLLSVELQLNNSIVQGPQKNDYLKDVKLQMLDQLNAHMTQSLIPSTQLILGQTHP